MGYAFFVNLFKISRNFPTLSGSNRMKSFESYPSCVGEVPAACRFERKARLRLASLHCKLGSEHSERISRRKHSKVSQNSTFDLISISMRIFYMKNSAGIKKTPYKKGECHRLESNQRHADFQSAALPTELQRRNGNIIYERLKTVNKYCFYFSDFL